MYMYIIGLLDKIKLTSFGTVVSFQEVQKYVTSDIEMVHCFSVVGCSTISPKGCRMVVRNEKKYTIPPYEKKENEYFLIGECHLYCS